MEVPQDRLARLRQEIQAGRDLVKDRIGEWQENIDYRVHRNTGAGRQNGDVTVPIDWSMTKQKHAQLASQVPDIRLVSNPGYEVAIPVFAKKLNRTLKKGNLGSALNEILPDVINASGIGACIVVYESRTEMRSIEVVPGNPATAQDQPHTTDKRFYVERFSPADLIIDATFTGSNFDNSRLVGRRRRTTWGDIARLFKLKPEQREQVEKATGTNTTEDRIQSENNRSTAAGNPPLCEYTELFYRRYFYHEDEPSFDAIQRVVFVDGIEEPVVDEPWTGQKYTESGQYAGSCRYPIRVLTLAYITDDAVPPSDSSMGRGQVIELNNARSEMQLQRKHSKPLRWADSNRLDADEIDKLNRGEWNDFIFTKGPGDGVVGEISRANYPSERYDFDRVFKEDLYLAYQTSANQMGAITAGETTAAESNNAQAGYQTRVSQEQAMVTEYIAGIGEVMGGLLSLYGDFNPPEFSPEEAQRIAQFPQEMLSKQFAYTVRPNAAVMVDAKARFAELRTYVDIAGQSGFVALKPIFTEMAELLNLDPAYVITDPPPRQPEPLNISIRSSEDLMNPAMMALLVHTGQAPTPEDMAAGMKIIDMAMSMQPKITSPEESLGAGGGDPTAEPGDPQLALEMMPTVTKRTDMQ